MTISWLVDGISIARNIKTCGLPSVLQTKDSGGNWECPQCSFRVDKCNVSNEWPGLPMGVKFDPSDVELLEHLAAKYGVGNVKPHQYIDEFIPTLDVEEGICYKHPKDLPGSRKDGNSFHFFYRTTNAYTTGQRKRRKVCTESSVRWHKTGKTKAILKNGVHIGFKKIMVLYKTANRVTKPCILNWVMHQYHLGNSEDEKDGEYVVSKIFFQAQKQQVENTSGVVESDDAWTSPRTPMTNVDPPRPVKTPLYEDAISDYQANGDGVSNRMQTLWCAIFIFSFYLIYFLKSDIIDHEKYLPSFATTLEHKDDLKVPTCNDDSKSMDLDTSLGITDLNNLESGSPSSSNLVERYYSYEDSSNWQLDWLDTE